MYTLKGFNRFVKEDRSFKRYVSIVEAKKGDIFTEGDTEPKDVKELIVNLWDDYRRKPEYNQVDDTDLKVETYELDDYHHKQAVEYLYSWIQANVKFDDVEFDLRYEYPVDQYGTNDEGKKPRKLYYINIKKLNDPEFRELLKILQTSNLKYEDRHSGSKVPYKFISES